MRRFTSSYRFVFYVVILSIFLFFWLVLVPRGYFGHNPQWPAIQTLNKNESIDPHLLYSGRPLIIHFWASWCAPCKTELPVLVKAEDLIRNHYNLLVVSLDEDPLNPLEMIKSVNKTPSSNWLGWDPQKKLAQKLGTVKMPETYFFDSHHQLVRKMSGSVDWLDEKNLLFISK